MCNYLNVADCRLQNPRGEVGITGLCLGGGLRRVSICSVDCVLVGFCGGGSHPDSTRMSGHVGPVASRGGRQSGPFSLGRFLICQLNQLHKMLSEAFQTYSCIMVRGCAGCVCGGVVLSCNSFPSCSSAKDDAALSGKRMQSPSLNK